MKLKGIGVSVIGPSHIQDDLPNQDSLSLRGHKGGWISSACDGLGSHQYSEHGSQTASQVIQDVFRKTQEDMSFSNLNKKIHIAWKEKVTPNLLAQASTTCLYSNVLKSGDATMGQLGDGLIIYKAGGEFCQMTPNREAYGNQTNALQKHHRENNWINAKCKFTQSGDGIILMTDGVSDDLKTEALPVFFNAIYELAAEVSQRRAKNWLRREFNDWTTPKHGDDKTLVAVFRV